MTLFHRRCQANEAALRAQVSDLQGIVEGLLQRLQEEQTTNAERNEELTDKILALTNPGALHLLNQGRAARLAGPAAPMPVVPTRLRRAGGTGGAGSGTGIPKAYEPVLTPNDAGFRVKAERGERGERGDQAPPEMVPVSSAK